MYTRRRLKRERQRERLSVSIIEYVWFIVLKSDNSVSIGLEDCISDKSEENDQNGDVESKQQ
jgi:hypothetical protein